jgi:hypothetical protein
MTRNPEAAPPPAALGNHTPMMAQYLAIKAEYPTTTRRKPRACSTSP